MLSLQLSSLVIQHFVALLMLGVLLLQGGQWYAEVAALRELKEIEANEREEAKKSQ
jgi:ER membrane protein SH3